MLERLDEEDEDEGEKKKRHGLQAKTRRRRKRASITRRERPTILSTIAIELALFLEFWEGKRERARTRGPLKWSLLYPIGERDARKRERETEGVHAPRYIPYAWSSRRGIHAHESQPSICGAHIRSRLD